MLKNSIQLHIYNKLIFNISTKNINKRVKKLMVEEIQNKKYFNKVISLFYNTIKDNFNNKIQLMLKSEEKIIIEETKK